MPTSESDDQAYELLQGLLLLVTVVDEVKAPTTAASFARDETAFTAAQQVLVLVENGAREARLALNQAYTNPSDLRPKFSDL